MKQTEFTLDFARRERIGIEEAVYCGHKSAAQIAAILDAADEHGVGLLLTRLDQAKLDALAPRQRSLIDYDGPSRTGFFGELEPAGAAPRVAILTAGTSDMPVAGEAARTLRYHGQASTIFADVGVAGLWRLMNRIEEVRGHSAVIVAAGMDAALPSVVAGLVSGLVIAVPTSVGYGVAEGGHAALNAILASCAPGIVVVNIDNGYGAACAALRLLNSPASAPAAIETHRMGVPA
jgi:NCAIR mutase (PurE)-related protein